MRTFLKVTFIWVFTLIISTRLGHAQSEGALILKSPPSSRLSTVITLPWGIAVGEFDGRSWLNPHNGLYTSKNLGESWEKGPLSGRGVKDLAYFQDKVYAATYYLVAETNGLFFSLDRGKTFEHLGPNFSASAVEVTQSVIYLGSYSHGLWVSTDGGSNWIQKIGDGTGWTGPNITTLASSEKISLASTSLSSYISKDRGNSWETISQLEGKKINNFIITNNVILAALSNNEGLLRSTDYGSNWNKVDSWGSLPAGDFGFFNNVYYSSKPVSQQLKLYKSVDFGLNWEDTEIILPSDCISQTALFSHPSYMFITTAFNGLYRMELLPSDISTFRFLNIPWNASNSKELVDKITATFDHEYPLLGYGYHSEPEEYRNSHLNFFGQKFSPPDLFYTSHNGTDFSLAYGTEVIAPAPGFAHYYYCNDCGNSIKIDHQNGYQAVYMHLQKNGLVSDKASDKIWVDTGAALGKVGLTGRTTGPHLHFQVLNDQNNNQVYDDYPYGLVDPFGWQSDNLSDTWPVYSWRDILGDHNGTVSKYLWFTDNNRMYKYMSETSDTIEINNLQISYKTLDQVKNRLTFFISEYTKPFLPSAQLNLRYIDKTSMQIDAIDHYGNKIDNPEGTVTISINLASLDFSNIVPDSLKIYSWNPQSLLWEYLPSAVDTLQNVISASTTHLSQFALFGNKTNYLPPTSNLAFYPQQEGGWFTIFPTITINSVDHSGLGIDKILYSTDDGQNWIEYTTPFEIKKEGITTLLYKAVDKTENWEDTNYQVIKVDTKNAFKKTISILGTSFTINF